MTKTALVCGISGQDGAYLAQLLLAKGYKVAGTTRDAQTSSLANLRTLGIRDQIEVHSMVLTDFRSTLQTLSRVKPSEVYNLAGQTSVSLSFQQPVEAFESIAIGTINLLESIRFMDKSIRLYNAGSSECFGDTGSEGANEATAFKPLSPYATAKAAAQYAVGNYREAYGLFACTGILFNHESPLRPAHFVTRKIVRAACDIARRGGGTLTLGNTSISRDWGWAPEYVEAMWRMMQLTAPEDFVIATGVTSTLTEFCEAVFAEVGLEAARHVVSDQGLFRPSDILISKGDPAKALRILGWRASKSVAEIVHDMVRDEHERTRS